MKYLVLLLFLFATHFVNSQTTIWLENFTSEGNNSTTGNNDNTVNAAVDWTTSCASCNLTNEFRVRGNRFKVENTNEIATWTSEKILLTGFTNISITVDVDMDDNQLDANDCLRLYYRLNGSTTNTSFPVNGNLCDDGLDPTVASYSIASADTIQIVITGITTNNNEDIHFDNILVTGDSIITPPTPDSIYAVATSPFCGDFIISDTAKAIPLESQALIWLKANKGTSTITNGNTFATWNDNSANGYDVSQTTPANRPTFRDNNTDNFNHNPTVEFINDNLNRAAPGIFSLTNYNHINTYFVIKDKDLANFDWMFYEGVSGFDRFSMSANYFGGTNFDFDPTTANRISAVSPAAGTINLYGFNTGTTSIYGLAQNQREVYSLNGSQLASDNTFIAYTGTNNAFYIGNQLTGGDASNSPFDGYFAELIIIDESVSLTYHQQIQTYLGIKYGLRLGHNYISPDSVILYDISNGYANGIFGIGRSKCFDFNQTKSKSESDYSGVTIETTLEIGDESYLMIGHDGAALTRVSLAGETNVLTRKWYGKMTKGLGTVTVELDLATIGANTSLAPADVKIGISNSAAFTFTSWISATSVSGGVATFTGIPLYNKYITFSAAP